MQDLFSQINKQMKESAKRWNEIDKVVANIKASQDTCDLKEVVNLLLLLVDQLRPPQNSVEQIEDLQKEVGDLLKNFNSQK